MPMSPSRLAALPLARHEVDRDYLSRVRPALFDELWAEASTRILPLWHGRTLLGAEGLDLLPVDTVTSATVRVYLGRTLVDRDGLEAGAAVVASVLTDGDARDLEADESRWMSLRDAASGLSVLDAGLFTEALAITNWHATHVHCPRCGMPTVIEQAGWVRRCFDDNVEAFPRTDSAVIVAVLDDNERILLASNQLWDENRYSLLAGFVEPGESFEAAVVREIGEEAGIRLAEPEYLGSQPWPFPASIMVGYRAVLADGESPDAATGDGVEIRRVRWFGRDELRAASDGDSPEIVLPGETSIARAIIDDWLETGP